MNGINENKQHKMKKIL